MKECDSGHGQFLGNFGTILTRRMRGYGEKPRPRFLQGTDQYDFESRSEPTASGAAKLSLRAACQ